jgi:hypothetical protein
MNNPNYSVALTNALAYFDRKEEEKKFFFIVTRLVRWPENIPSRRRKNAERKLKTYISSQISKKVLYFIEYNANTSMVCT